MVAQTNTVAGSDAEVHKLKIQQRTWNVMPSEFSEGVVNPVRKIVDNIKMPESSEKKMIPLSLGDPTVFGNLKCPDVLVDAMVRNLRSMNHNGYVHSAGSESARAAVAEHYGSPESPLTKDDVVITTGCSNAIEIALRGLVNPGDNVLIPKPGFPMYQIVCDAHKINYKFYNLLPEKNWEADVAHMESLIDDNTKVIIVNNPSNPCGSVYSQEHLEHILALADTYKLPILADEIYGDMVFGKNKFLPMASLTQTVPVIALGGLAKKFVVPGWRVGWVIVHDRNDILKGVRAAYFKLSQMILGANSLVLSVIPDLLTPVPGSAEEASLEAFKHDYYGTLAKNAELTTEALGKIPGLEVVVPQGAMYVMAKINTAAFTDIKDDVDFMQKLLTEESVFVLPGSFFGSENYFRVVFAAPHDVLSDAYARVANFCARHHSQVATVA